MRRLVLCAALVATALAGGVSSAEARLTLGFTDNNYASSHPKAFYRDMFALNARAMRINVSWSVVARRRPKDATDPGDKAYDWSYYDALVRGVARHRQIAPMITIWGGTPVWARLNASWRHRYSVPRPAALAAFATAAATRYSGTFDPDRSGPLTVLPAVHSWEIWNEPQLRTVALYFGTSLPSTEWTRLAAHYYAPMLRASYVAIHDVGDELGITERVAGCSCARAHTLPFLLALRAELGADPPWDVVSVHPYNTVPRLGIADGSQLDRGARNGDIAIGNFALFVRQLDTLWPHRRYRIWVTEYGWQTYPDRTLGISPGLQATFLRQSIAIFRKQYRRVDMLLNYTIKDEPMTYSASWQSGLRFANGRLKPAFFAWQAAAR